MGIIYIVSVEAAAGKTAFCAGLAGFMLGAGKKVGYLKPQAVLRNEADADISFMKQLLGLDDVVNAPDIIQGRDAVLVEAMLGSSPDDILSRNTYGAAREMQGTAIVVEPYRENGADYTGVYKGFGDSLAGIVVNKVPAGLMKEFCAAAETRFSAAGVKFLGAIPEDRRLLAVTVAELAEKLNGTILNSTDKAGELVEGFMLGAMVVDSGPEYFGRMSQKAAIIRGDRPDMQLAALETSTACLVCTGSGDSLLYNVRQKAENKGVPIIAADMAVGDIAGALDDILLSSRIHQNKKFARLTEMVRQHLDTALFA